MFKNANLIPIIVLPLFLYSCSSLEGDSTHKMESYADVPFIQDYSIKYYRSQTDIELISVMADRNERIIVNSSAGCLQPAGGEFMYPGLLKPDALDRQITDKGINGMTFYNDQFVYVNDKAVFSNGWAGALNSLHNLTGARIIEGGRDFSFLISDGNRILLLKNSEVLWEGRNADDIIREIHFDTVSGKFFILGNETINSFDPVHFEFQTIFSSGKLRCMGLARDRMIAGTDDGYIVLDLKAGGKAGELNSRMPCTALRVVKEIDGNLWFGSDRGAFMLKGDGGYNYYASERWLPSDRIVDIAAGPDNSVLVLTEDGLARICFRNMTLSEKADFFEKQVRLRHIRLGFNATLSSMHKGDISTGNMSDSDNDGLWTSMYLAAEALRYKVTGNAEALENVRESLMAMEKLFTVNALPGFPARSFTRRGYKFEDEPWRRAKDPEWDWKSTTSSDEAIGHMFAYGVIAELIDDPDIKSRSVMLMDTLMSHIVRNEFYLVDWDGKPTRWGRWNPYYVNSFPEMVGDRKLNSSNIIAMLQTAYYFTGKEKYRKAAFYLFQNHGYLENLMRPMKDIGSAPATEGRLAMELSDGWNHSDDEMYYCGYWGLYRYAFNDSLREKYSQAIADHWQAERPEKEGLWNIMTAMTGTGDFDPDEAIWYLQEYPMDLVSWTVHNSHRNDIEMVESNFRNQTTKEVLPPDELRISRHNANRFILDGGDDGRSEYSAGDIWLLPYWMARYLGVIK